MNKIASLLKNKMLKDGMLSIGAKVIFFLVLKFMIEPWMNVRMGDTEFGHYVLVMGYISILAYSFGEALNHIRVLNQSSDRERAAEYRMMIGVEGLITFLALGVYGIFAEGHGILDAALLGLAGMLMMLRLYAECMFRIEINYLRILVSSILMAGGYLAGYFWFTKGAPWYVILIWGEAAAVLYAAAEGKAFRVWQGVSEKYLVTVKNTVTLTVSYFTSYALIYLDRFLVAFLLNDELVSIYYISTTYGKCVALVIPPITAVLLSNISKGLVRLDRKMVNRVFIGSLGAVAFFFLAGIPASRIIIYLRYASSYEACLPIMDIGNLAQIVYYSCSIVNMLAIRLCPMKLQVKVEGAYAVIFILLAWAGAKLYGLTGLAIGTLAANTLRFIMLTVPVYRAIGNKTEYEEK